jgi:pimeloyl-ACP methyl ester carboxylesterase
MSRINIGEISLNYNEQGRGEPILFIPGMMGLLDAWKFQLEYFSSNYRCISFDHRGTGESDKPSNAYSTELVAQDAIALLDKLGIERAHIVGTSTGGCVLQVIAIDHPERLRTATLNNTWTTADGELIVHDVKRDALVDLESVGARDGRSRCTRGD